MGKSCLNKLTGNITQECTVNPVGVKGLYLMHPEDVTLATDESALSVLTAGFVSDAVVTSVEGYKQNIQITGAMRSSEASAKMDWTIMFKTSKNLPGTAQRLRTLLTGKFYVMAELNDGNCHFFGFTSAMECTGMDWDSNAGAGLITVTMAAPEGAAGNYLMGVAPAAVTSIKAKVRV